MSKIHPGKEEESRTEDYCINREEEEVVQQQVVYTIWMKSLILGGKGCSVYDSKGGLVYRVDNYHSKSTTELTLMDSCGKLLCTLLRKKFKLCGVWEGYRPTPTPTPASASAPTSTSSSNNILKRRPWFRVRKPAWKVFSSSCEVTITANEEGDDDETLGRLPCRIIRPVGVVNKKSKKKWWSGIAANVNCTVVDSRGGVLAEVKRKQSSEGVVFGEDVSTMMLHPTLDPSLIMSLLLSYALLFSPI